MLTTTEDYSYTYNPQLLTSDNNLIAYLYPDNPLLPKSAEDLIADLYAAGFEGITVTNSSARFVRLRVFKHVDLVCIEFAKTLRVQVISDTGDHITKYPERLGSDVLEITDDIYDAIHAPQRQPNR